MDGSSCLLERALGRLRQVAFLMEQSVGRARVGMEQAPTFGMGKKETGRITEDDFKAEVEEDRCLDPQKELSGPFTASVRKDAERAFSQRVSDTRLLHHLLINPSTNSSRSQHQSFSSSSSSSSFSQLTHRDLKEAELVQFQAGVARLQDELASAEQVCRSLAARNRQLCASQEPAAAVAPKPQLAPNWPRFVMQSLLLESGINWGSHPELWPFMLLDRE